MDYMQIVNHYEACLSKHGDTHLGVDWPNALDATVRYDVMLGVIRDTQRCISLLDFGCGAGHLLSHIQSRKLGQVSYTGIDISPKYIDLCKKKFVDGPKFMCVDILKNPPQTVFDYVIANGVFTEKQDASFDDMFSYFRRMITVLFSMSAIGIAFNVMSKQVQWERDDLFHLSLGDVTDFIGAELSRHFVIRNDYGLYEYTVFLYKKPNYETSYFM